MGYAAPDREENLVVTWVKKGASEDNFQELVTDVGDTERVRTILVKLKQSMEQQSSQSRTAGARFYRDMCETADKTQRRATADRIITHNEWKARAVSFLIAVEAGLRVVKRNRPRSSADSDWLVAINELSARLQSVGDQILDRLEAIESDVSYIAEEIERGRSERPIGDVSTDGRVAPTRTNGVRVVQRGSE